MMKNPFFCKPLLSTEKLAAFLFFITASLQTQAGWGQFLYESNRSVEAWLVGLTEHTVTVDNTQWHYYVRNPEASECIVLIHGFTAEAGNWFRFALNLDRDHCLIIPDLPGFGQSPYDPALSYAIPDQAKRLRAFLLHIRPQGALHLVGSSMGGHIALDFTLLYPQYVLSLALIDAGGVNSPVSSELTEHYSATGRSVFDIREGDDFDLFLRWAMHDVPWMPGPVKNHLRDEFVERNARYMAIWDTIFGKQMRDDRLPEVMAPTLVLWGSEDRLLHVSMAHVFAEGIPNVRKVVMENTGHLPFLESPRKSAKIYSEFLSSVPREPR